MIKKEFINVKKEYIMNKLGKGRITDLKIERTPIGEKIILMTAHPGMVIGRNGEVIQELSKDLNKIFKFENPQIEISEIKNPEFNAQYIADSIAMSLERFGPMGFKIVAYRELERLSKSGALGAEIKMGGRLPSERAKSWRFGFGFLIKTGDSRSICDEGKAVAFTKPGAVGIKVTVIPKGTKIPDRIEINKDLIDIQLKKLSEEIESEDKEKKNKSKKKAKWQ